MRSVYVLALFFSTAVGLFISSVAVDAQVVTGELNEAGGFIVGSVTSDDTSISTWQVAIFVYDAKTRDFVDSQWTDENGAFRIGPLPYGEYVVRAADERYGDMYYKDATTFESATRVPITASSSEAEVNFGVKLPEEPRGSIKGSVAIPDDFGEDATVAVFIHEDGDFTDITDVVIPVRFQRMVTRAKPDFSFDFLPLGDYILGFGLPDGTQLFYDGATELAGAKTITVSENVVDVGTIALEPREVEADGKESQGVKGGVLLVILLIAVGIAIAIAFVKIRQRNQVSF